MSFFLFDFCPGSGTLLFCFEFVFCLGGVNVNGMGTSCFMNIDLVYLYYAECKPQNDVWFLCFGHFYIVLNFFVSEIKRISPNYEFVFVCLSFYFFFFFENLTCPQSEANGHQRSEIRLI